MGRVNDMCKKPSFDVAAARERALAAMTAELVFNQKESTRSHSIGANGKVTIADSSIDAMSMKIDFGTASSSGFAWPILGDKLKAYEENQLLGLPVREDSSISSPNVVFGHHENKVTMDMVIEAANNRLKMRRKT